MLVGRDEEVAALENALVEGSAAVVVGEAGIGKTALVRAACSEAGVRALEGGGLQTLASVPHLALTRALGEAPPAGDELAAAEFVVERAAGKALLLDDLHWADPETMAVLPHLVGRLPLLAAVRKGDPAAKRVTELLVAAGCLTVELGPLDREDARVLLRAIGADLEAEKLEEVISNAHGNPLLLEELAKGDGAEPSLSLALASRLHSHDEQVRTCAARAALLGRPAGPDLLGDGIESLRDAGLLIERDGMFELRHSLLAEAILDELDGPARRELHASIAASVSDPGEAARHHRDAGQRQAAKSLALEAAERSTRPAERADHLAVAATCADGDDADPLRLRAAAELNDAGRPTEALELLDEIEDGSTDAQALRALEEGRALGAIATSERAQRAFDAGLALVRGTYSEVEVRLLLASAENLQRAEWSSAASMERSAEALELSRATGIAEAEAARVHAVALYVGGEQEQAIDIARSAGELARARGEILLGLEAGQLLAGALASLGEYEEAIEICAEVAAQAREEGLRALETNARAQRALFATMRFGECAAGIEEIERLLPNHLTLGPQIDELRSVLGYALADTGRISEARAMLQTSIDKALSETGRALLLGALADAEWLAGRPRPALEAARRALQIDTESPNRAAAELMLRWAQLEDGGAPERLVADTGFPLDASIEAEADAVAVLAGDPAQAATAAPLFRAAAEGWARFELRGELRCLWACGEAYLQAGEREAATAVLLEAETKAEAVGMMPLLGRVRGSLRRAGVRRPGTRRGGVAGLSAREHEVMLLVAEGRSSAEAAARLAISRSTVETLVSSAMARLGAKNRRQAALRVLDESEGGG